MARNVNLSGIVGKCSETLDKDFDAYFAKENFTSTRPGTSKYFTIQTKTKEVEQAPLSTSSTAWEIQKVESRSKEVVYSIRLQEAVSH